jgi:predicted phage terminase large subunit-like protein
MGDCIPAGGAIFRSECFEHRYTELPRHCIDRRVVAPQSIEEQILGANHAFAPLPLIVIQACDPAWKTGLTNDRSCVATLVSDERDIYVTDVWFGRLAFTDLQRKMVELYDEHRPSRLYVEEAASGFALVDSLKRATGINIIGIPPGRESKEARWESTTGWFEAGRVKFPQHASWMPELLGEFLRAPVGRHDDIVDGVCLGVRMMRETIGRRRAQQHSPVKVVLGDWMAR